MTSKNYDDYMKRIDELVCHKPKLKNGDILMYEKTNYLAWPLQKENQEYLSIDNRILIYKPDISNIEYFIKNDLVLITITCDKDKPFPEVYKFEMSIEDAKKFISGNNHFFKLKF